jgi:NTP-dependent ternary system trypsin peptidase co-occuring protein
MTELVQFELEGGGASLLVEVEEDEPGIERASRIDDLVIKGSQSLEAALEGIRSAANVTLAKLRNVAEAPDEVEVQFGVRLNAQAGAVIAKTEAEGHLQVRMAWKRSG